MRRLILQSVLGWAAVAIGLGAGEPAPKRAHTAHQTIRLRDPTEALTLRLDHPHLIFDPQEILRGTVWLDRVESRQTQTLQMPAHQASGKPAKASIKWKLLPARHSRPVSGGTLPLVVPPGQNGPAEVPLEFALPGEEGVYELRITASSRRLADAELVVQLVVFDAAHPTGISQSSAEKLVDSFEPATSGFFRKVSVDRSRTKLDQPLARFLKFPRHRDEASGAAADLGDSHTVAYRLKVSHPGRPHRFELALSGTAEQSAVCCLLESDGQGKFVPLGPRTAVSIAAGQRDEPRRHDNSSTETCVYRQIFWPNDREPVVFIAGGHADHPIDVSRVELFEMGERLPVAPSTGFDHSSLQWKQRLVGLHLGGTDLTRNFGAPKFFDTGEKRLVDDWQSFWIAGHRLTDYLRYQQYNSLLLAVSTHEGNSMRAANREGVSQKDVLELLLRLFDREDLVLVPELQFDEPLQAIEYLLRDQPETAGDLQLVNAAGRARAEVDGKEHAVPAAELPRGQGGGDPVAELARVRETSDELNSGEFGDHQESLPHASRRALYNILSPRVQQAALEATREFVERYAAHPSFGGVAFELGHDSFLQLPGIEWGYDADTVRRFEQATRLQVPRTSRPEAQQQAAYRYLTTTARREWLRYRCGEVARFHRKLAELVLAAKPDAQVYFSGRLWTGGDPGAEERSPEGAGTEGAVVDFVRTGGGPAQLLLARGLDFAQSPYATDGRVTVLRPFVQINSDERLPQAAAATLNHSPAIDTLYRVVSPGGLLYSPAIETHYAPREVDAGRGATAETPRPTDSRVVVQNYAHLLATLDAQVVFDGSDASPLPATDPTRRMRTTIAALPGLSFHPAGPQPQPLVIRSAQHGNITWLYAVNDSSLPVAVDLVLDCPAGTTCRMLDGGRPPALEALADKRARLHIDLTGNELWACRFERAGVAVVDTRLTISGETLAGVEHRIDHLAARMQAMSSLARAGSRQLANPGFEQQGARTRVLPGWELPVEQAGWSLDEDNPRSGHRSLAISAEANKTALASPLLSLEGSRFVTLSLWLRSDKPSARVQLVFEASVDDEPFRHEQPVEAGKTWQQHVFRVDPLPAGRMQNARLCIRPIDSCKLWVDDVEIGAQSFSADEVRQLTKTLSSVKLAWESGRYADCQRLLDGYWGQLLLAEPAAVPPISDKPRLGDRLRKRFR